MKQPSSVCKLIIFLIEILQLLTTSYGNNDYW